ncbi:hypothetical protein BABA_25401 [Neobacillus bataviensis LMG 21833]|uniref:Flp/Fap pilin component n=1 Tax=Neobacillus bataviensis LMG 21833 TaxID=1117379 RepID=K6DP46_9BACI|nr:Flp family type IVb pilin [Neobacillus bataviensis]EKN62546.1 hypothetical protein BABA_25401 [Neobacillus bataviensis LMG 21833]
MLKKMKNLVVEEKGQALTEYGLIIGLIAVALLVVVVALGDQIKAKFNEIIVGLGGTAK